MNSMVCEKYLNIEKIQKNPPYSCWYIVQYVWYKEYQKSYTILICKCWCSVKLRIGRSCTTNCISTAFNSNTFWLLSDGNKHVTINIIKKERRLIVGSSALSHLVFGILRFRTNIWHFNKAFRVLWYQFLHKEINNINTLFNKYVHVQ